VRERISRVYDEITAPQPPRGRETGRRAVATPVRASAALPPVSDAAEITDAVLDGLDRLADRLDPNKGLAAIAHHLDSFIHRNAPDADAPTREAFDARADGARGYAV
jgi:hypothetical protein